MAKGFADAANFPLVRQSPGDQAASTPVGPARDDPGAAHDDDGQVGHGQAGDSALPFASTGPWGHRGRMRDKLLQRGPDALADYEMLEMLLFLALPRGDTKPLAKAVINRFGSFAAVLAAPDQALRATPGLNTQAVVALKLAHASALRLARSEVTERPVLGDWDTLMGYLGAAVARDGAEQVRILFLDSRNRLLADEAQETAAAIVAGLHPREVARRALELHATALILVRSQPEREPTASQGEIQATARLREAAQALSIVVHDHVVLGRGRWLSFRSEGLL